MIKLNIEAFSEFFDLMFKYVSSIRWVKFIHFY